MFPQAPPLNFDPTNMPPQQGPPAQYMQAPPPGVPYGQPSPHGVPCGQAPPPGAPYGQPPPQVGPYGQAPPMNYQPYPAQPCPQHGVFSGPGGPGGPGMRAHPGVPPQGYNYGSDPNMVFPGNPALFQEGPAPEVIPPDQYHKSDYKHTGKKKALLIGINYFQTQYELKGCINDVKNIKEFLLEKGFKDDPSSMVILTDDNPNQLPLRSNIIASCEWLVKDAQPGDSLFFHYSGHGEQVPDTDGDEVDGLDETILPLDFKKAGYIVDDDLHNMLVRPLVKGVRLTALFDSCHSGTALDLPYIFKSDGTYHEVGLSIRYIPKTLTEAGVEALHGDTEAAKKKLLEMGKVLLTAKKKAKKLRKTNSSPAEVLMFSGCKDEQNAADTAVPDPNAAQAEALVSTGLMSHALITSLRNNPHQSLIELVNSMREIILQKGDTQKPQLSTSHPIDPNTILEI